MRYIGLFYLLFIANCFSSECIVHGASFEIQCIRIERNNLYAAFDDELSPGNFEQTIIDFSNKTFIIRLLDSKGNLLKETPVKEDYRAYRMMLDRKELFVWYLNKQEYYISSVNNVGDSIVLDENKGVFRSVYSVSCNDSDLILTGEFGDSRKSIKHVLQFKKIGVNKNDKIAKIKKYLKKHNRLKYFSFDQPNIVRY